MAPEFARGRRQVMRLALLRLAGRAYRRRSAGGAPRSLLLIRPDHLGDLLFLTPALRALRTALPAARITLLVGPWTADLARQIPDVDAVSTCVFPGFERTARTPVASATRAGEVGAAAIAPYRMLWQQAARLRGRYDAAVVLRYDHWWGAWLAAAAGIGYRLGFDWPETVPFLTQAVPYRATRHEVEQDQALLRRIAPVMTLQPGPLQFSPAAADLEWAAGWLAAAGCDPTRPLAAIHPGAGAPVKQWPAALWGEVAAGLAQRGAQVVITGSAGEAPLADTVVRAGAAQGGVRAMNAAGATSLGQLAALQQACAVVLGSDCGPLHLAVAVGRPTVHLFGPADPAKFGPWGAPERHRVLVGSCPCAPCGRFDWPPDGLAGHGCMASITPAQVLDAAGQLLAETRRDVAAGHTDTGFELS